MGSVIAGHPATVEQAIQMAYGVRLPATPADCKYRIFKIDDFHNGFIMKSDSGAIFGSRIGQEGWIYTAMGIEWLEFESKSSKKICHEWLIWNAAQAMIARGERLSSVDKDRLALCVQRLEAWI